MVQCVYHSWRHSNRTPCTVVCAVVIDWYSSSPNWFQSVSTAASDCDACYDNENQQLGRVDVDVVESRGKPWEMLLWSVA